MGRQHQETTFISKVQFVEQSKTLLEAGEKMFVQSTNLSNAKITVGCPSHIAHFYLMECIEKARKDYPNLSINILAGLNANDMIKLLEKHEIHFMIDSTHCELKNKDITVKIIREVNNTFVSKSALKINNLKDLEQLKLILPFSNTSTTKSLINVLSDYKVLIDEKNKNEIDITELRIEEAKRNLGVAYVMEDAVKQDLINKELYKVKLPIELPKSEIKLIYIKNQLTGADKKFIERYVK